jgi:hypothetical protein
MSPTTATTGIAATSPTTGMSPTTATTGISTTNAIVLSITFATNVKVTKATLVNSVVCKDLGQINGMLIQDDNIYVTTDRNTFNAVLPSGQFLHLAGALDGSEGFQDGKGADARFDQPHGIAPFPGIDGAFLIADQGNHSIRKVTHTGEVTTFVGEKKSGWLDGDNGLFKKPIDIIVSPDNNLIVCDKRNHALRTVSLSKEIKTLTGNSHSGTNDYNFFIDGPAEESFFFEPCAIALDRSGRILVADYFNNAVRLVDTSGKVTTIAGTGAPGHVDGPGRTAQFSRPSAIAVDDHNNIFVADEHNDCIRMITSDPTEPETYNVTTLAFPGQPFELSNPVVLAIDKLNRIYVAEFRSTASFRVISI